MMQFEDIKEYGIKPLPKYVQINIPNAKKELEECFRHFVKDFQWLPEYDAVVDWLTDNKGKGLFLYGNCGRGKSLLGRWMIPFLLLKHHRKVVSVFDMHETNKDIDYVLAKHIIYLDDVGVEDFAMHYGEKRCAFAEVMDAAEKSGKLLIVSTNLNASMIREKYGDRVLDRIKGITKRVLFSGESLRK